VIIELRTYRAKPGRRDEFVRLFRTKLSPGYAAYGMRVVGPFLSIDDPDTCFVMRAFPDRSSHEPMKARFHDGDVWRNELKHLLLPLLDDCDVVVVEDAAGEIHW
jgi:NIPSNAP